MSPLFRVVVVTVQRSPRWHNVIYIATLYFAPPYAPYARYARRISPLTKRHARFIFHAARQRQLTLRHAFHSMLSPYASHARACCFAADAAMPARVAAYFRR